MKEPTWCLLLCFHGFSKLRKATELNNVFDASLAWRQERGLRRSESKNDFNSKEAQSFVFKINKKNAA